MLIIIIIIIFIDSLLHRKPNDKLITICSLPVVVVSLSNTRSNNVQQKLSHVTHQSPQSSNTSATNDSSSEADNRVLTLGKCKINNEELLSSDGSSELYRSSFFRPGPKIPLVFNRSTSIPTMPRSASDLIAIGTIPILTSQRQTPVKPMSR